MNHLESSFTGKNNFWRYFIMIAAVFLASNSIGAVPLLIAIAIQSVSSPDIISNLAANPNDYSVIGLDPNLLLTFMLIPFLVSLIAYLLLVKPLNQRSWRETINGSGKLRWNRFFISFALWMVLSGIYFFVYLKIDPENFILNNTSKSLLILALVSFLLIPFQAAFEEIIFRGYLMQGFANVIRNRWFPLVTTSVLFGLMHSLNPEVKEFGFLAMMPQYIGIGLMFGIITIMDDGIEAAMGAHSANNIFLCIMVTHKSVALQTVALYEQKVIYPWTDLVSLILMGALFIIILKLIFRWGSFSLLREKILTKNEATQIP
jgi:membrane protease YdiL (CAAX protease family)